MNIPALAKQLKEIPPTVITLNYKDKFLRGSVLSHGTRAQIQFVKIRWSGIGHSWTSVNEKQLIKKKRTCLFASRQDPRNARCDWADGATASEHQQNSTSVVEFSPLDMFSVLKSQNKTDGCPNAMYYQHGRQILLRSSSSPMRGAATANSLLCA